MAHCARILAVLPMTSKSHMIMHYAIFKLLQQRGHEVVVYSGNPLPSTASTDNITYTYLPSPFQEMTDARKFEEFLEFCKTGSYFGFGFGAMSKWGEDLCHLTFQNSEIKKLLRSNEKFDLVFLEPLLGQESLLVFGHKFKAPVINFQGFGTWTLANWVAGNSLSISHIPVLLSFQFSNKMSFIERLRNFISTVVTLWFYHSVHLPKQQEVIDYYYKDPTTPPVEELVRDIALVLSHSLPGVEYPQPHTPNIIHIGGFHMSSHLTPLPEDIGKFMGEAKEGVVFFSLGTIVPTHLLPNEYLQAFTNPFKKLKQKVLWKISLDSVPNLPNNVMLTKWVPQPTVLAHPKCILFITHGGLVSQQEVLHAGVPVIAIPFFFDQRYNVRVYKELGMGVELDFATLTEKSFSTAVNMVLSDQRYKENAEKVSRIYKDEPQSAAERLGFWLEYVLRHRGAEHLRPAAANRPWYQLYLLDVTTAVFISIVTIFTVLFIIAKSLLNMCFFVGINRILVCKKKN